MSAQEHARFALLVERIKELKQLKADQRERDSRPELLKPQAE